MLLMLIVLVGLGVGGFLIYRKLNEKPQVPQSFEEVVKGMFDQDDKEQKKQYEELMRAWNYNGRKKELVDEQ